MRSENVKHVIWRGEWEVRNAFADIAFKETGHLTGPQLRPGKNWFACASRHSSML